MTVSLRQARVSDAASLVAVRASASASAAAERADRAPGDAVPDASDFARLLERHAACVYVAEVDSAVAGYLLMERAAHQAIIACRPIQLRQLYVLPAFHGSGVAAQLMSAALEHARVHQHDVIWLGVSEDNPRARAFYRKQGFEVVGVHTVASGSLVHPDVVM